MRAEILTIGDELCRGEIVDTNSAYLAEKLWDLDITTQWMTSCNDANDDIAAALLAAVGRADIVVCSGGLGPTEDDLTVDVLGGLVGVPALIDEPSRAKMDAWFARSSTANRPSENSAQDPRTVNEPGSSAQKQTAIEHRGIQLRQVRIPQGARVFHNTAGLAPGFEIALRGVPVMCLPGVPREVTAIWDAGFGARVAELREHAGDVERVERCVYRVFGRSESDISRSCRGIVDDVPGASIHYQVKFPETLVKLVVRDRDRAIARLRLDAMDAALRQRLGDVVYGTGAANLPIVVMQQLIAGRITVATAESCTGGMIGELLTAVPGASAVFLGGAITYSNAEKVRQLGVLQATLDAHGAVSESTVREMARGCCERFGSQLAVAVSGVAGPDGGTDGKPVGTVWIAVASPAGVATKQLHWPGSRDQIRILAAWWALRLIQEAIGI